MSSPKLTFVQYLHSKDQLRSAAGNIPQQTVEYVVQKYCKVPVGESKEDREHISLKPTQRVLVDWLYEDPENPTPLNIKFDGPESILPDEERTASWNGQRLLKWLTNNTKQV